MHIWHPSRPASLAIVAMTLLFGGCTSRVNVANTTPGITTIIGTTTLARTADTTALTPIYQNPNAAVPARVEDLLSRMTLPEKIGQMTLIEKDSLTAGDVTEFMLGGALSGGGGSPSPNTPEGWVEMIGAFQRAALETRLGIPILYGSDAVHGHGNLHGATIFPHNIGLGAAGDPALVEEIGRATAIETAATGVTWNFAPVLAVAGDVRWGRTYESYGEDTQLVANLGSAYLRGLQGDDLAAVDSVLGTPKHFIGDGGTGFGSSVLADGLLDRGDTRGDETALLNRHLSPYAAVVEAGARSVMASFSSWNGVKVHADHHLLTELLRGELGFTGFVVSDWAGVDEILPADYEASVVAGINAGIDMVMVPSDFRRFIAALTAAVKTGKVSEDRIDEAVSRILMVKFERGVFEEPFPDASLIDSIGSENHRLLAAEAVQRSLVLLENDGTLPLDPSAGPVLVAGRAADDVGIQAGGWTIEWQGSAGAITEGSTILEGIGAMVGENTVYAAKGNLDQTAPMGIVVVSESPYAEWFGDSPDLALSPDNLETVIRVRELVDRLVVVVVSGRPVDLTGIIEQADAVVAAWLPGSEGAAVVDVLYGRAPFTGHLPFTWPRNAAQLPIDPKLPTETSTRGCDGPLFPYGHGLSSEERHQAEAC